MLRDRLHGLRQRRLGVRRGEQLNLNVGGTPLLASASSSNNGWTAGAGLEYAFWGTWSARVEYDFVRLNNATYTVSGAASNGVFANDVITSNNRQINLITVGLNYKFGPW